MPPPTKKASNGIDPNIKRSRKNSSDSAKQPKKQPSSEASKPKKKRGKYVKKQDSKNDNNATKQNPKASAPRPMKPAAHPQQNQTQTGPKTNSLHSSTKFNDIETLHPMTKKAISEMIPHEYMTEIQAQTFHIASTGKDVLGRARTGAGKTLAFLIPALQTILDGTNPYQNGKMVGIVVISPTRELATQIGNQAKLLIAHHRNLSCMVMYGGTKMNADVNRLNKQLPTILVTTPGTCSRRQN
jgi:ATP-dependent RNA helicase MSS116